MDEFIPNTTGIPHVSLSYFVVVKLRNGVLMLGRVREFDWGSNPNRERDILGYRLAHGDDFSNPDIWMVPNNYTQNANITMEFLPEKVVEFLQPSEASEGRPRFRAPSMQRQEGGDHYRKLRIQPVEYIHANNIGFIEGSVIKYMTRWRDKGGVGDLRKARHFIDMLIDFEEKNGNPEPR